MYLVRIMERHQAAYWLATQGTLRVSGLLGIAMLGALNKALGGYLLCLQHSSELMREAESNAPPEQLVAGYVDAVSEYVENSWQDFRNHLQIMLLTQGEATAWLNQIDRALLTE